LADHFSWFFFCFSCLFAKLFALDFCPTFFPFTTRLSNAQSLVLLLQFSHVDICFFKLHFSAPPYAHESVLYFFFLNIRFLRVCASVFQTVLHAPTDW